MKAEVLGSTWIQGGRIVDPSRGIDVVADLVIEGDRLGAMVPPGQTMADGRTVIDARGLIVAPGFVDVHVHLRSPGQAHKETMASGTAAAIRGGFTTVCAMANTAPVVDSVETLSEVQQWARDEGHCHVLSLAAVTVGLQGRLSTDARALVDHGAVALSDDGMPVADDDAMIGALRASERLGVPVSVHEEAPDIVGHGVANAGCAERHGLRPWPCAGEIAMVRRDVALLRRHGGRLHIAHVSCAETLQLIAHARESGLAVTAEVTPHHLLLTDVELNGDAHLPPTHSYTKVNPPLRSRNDIIALRAGLRDGVIDAVATDHAPHSVSDKSTSYANAAFGISGIELALPLLLSLERAGALTLPQVIERLTAGPARAFGLSCGTLAPGTPADVCIFDPDAVWQAGRDTLVSKGKNTPLRGARLQGRVRHGIVGGRIHSFEQDHVLRAA